ncbi:hypothetical protein [Methyloglobulus morosus]|uniref:hypothetical protein n=1 Tax=Methyloglobulus morosus TaxID=1410681 RepID=UPI000421C9F6|nr:hypothetical protein [Methyloglobulus morosus]
MFLVILVKGILQKAIIYSYSTSIYGQIHNPTNAPFPSLPLPQMLISIASALLLMSAIHLVNMMDE